CVCVCVCENCFKIWHSGSVIECLWCTQGERKRALWLGAGHLTPCHRMETPFALFGGSMERSTLTRFGACPPKPFTLITSPHPTLIARFLAPLATGVEDIVAIMIPEPKGKEIVSLLERNITVMMYITIGTRNLQKYVSRTSVVFVSISFIVLMIISLAWLVFYYIQRFRYANARDRNQRRLGDAAKKAISKLQVRTIRKGDKETESDFDNCAVCIEGYKPNDVVRILPCRHLFHKSCVDPWLLDHRTCPMCKMNILKALGIPPNADCMDDLPIDFEGSLGGPPTNQITGASDTTVNESSVTLDPAVRTVGALQVVQDPDPAPQEGEAIFTTNSDQEPAVSSDSDISLIMALEVGLSDVELSTDQDCEEVKS
uniref:RING-type domain-containing protein n=1 Tax=Mus spicilegus TaxID=10103 RepID=A0A8C6GYD5_MUSSI